MTTIKELIKDALVGKQISANCFFDGEDWFISSKGLGDDKLFTIQGVNHIGEGLVKLNTDYGYLYLFFIDKFEIL